MIQFLRRQVRWVRTLTLGAAISWATPSPAPIIWGTSGDWVEFAFLDGQRLAVEQLRHTPPSLLEEAAAEHGTEAVRLREFFAAYRNRLADVVGTAGHIRADALGASCRADACACAGWDDGKPVVALSFDRCRGVAHDLSLVTRLLVHEGSHHLGVEDEALATAIADVAYQAWSRYAPQPAARLEVAVTNRSFEGEVRGAPLWHASRVWSALARSNPRWGPVAGGFISISPGESEWDVDLPFGHDILETEVALASVGTRVAFAGFTRPTLPGRPESLIGFYDDRTGAWEEAPLAPISPARRGHLALEVGGRLLIWGGRSTEAPVRRLNDGAVFDPTRQTWRPMSQVAAPTATPGAVAVGADGRMIVWGGADSLDPAPVSRLQATALMHSYDPVRDQWRRLADSPFSCDGARGYWTGDKFLLFGPCGPFGETMGALYDPRGDHWRVLPAGPGSYEEVGWAGSRFIVVETRSRQNYRQIWSYDPRFDRWRVVGRTNEVQGPIALVSGDDRRIVIVGPTLRLWTITEGGSP